MILYQDGSRRGFRELSAHVKSSTATVSGFARTCSSQRTFATVVSAGCSPAPEQRQPLRLRLRRHQLDLIKLKETVWLD